MTITAKFSSKCPRCDRQISAGEQVEWNRGERARHLSCQATVQTAVVETAPQRIAVEDEGVYVLGDGAIVKVQANREKTRTYAKRLVEIGGRRLTEAGERVNAEYQYESGLVQQVAAEGRKMTLEEAKAFILRYGFCARCSRQLKDAVSVERGIGPVCITYFSGAPAAPEAPAGIARPLGAPTPIVTREAAVTAWLAAKGYGRTTSQEEVA